MKLILALLFPLTLVAANPFPEPAVVTAAMKKATAFYQEKLAVHGGYASAWPQDLSYGITEGKQSKSIISIQPPGTSTVGYSLVKAYQATGDEQFLTAAKAAGRALVECQLSSGGWGSDFDFDAEVAKKYHLRQQVLAGDTEVGKRNASSTLDDNKTQSALLFLLELANLPECKDDANLQACLKFGLDSLLTAQFPNGAWPQQFDKPVDTSLPVVKATYPETWSRTYTKIKYTSYYTLNDHNMQRTVQVLLRAHELTKDERFLNAVKKAGDFFILAQMPEPQPVWAQQYDQQMQPVWARKFEPPSVTAGESLSTMETLHEIYVITGDEKYLKPLHAAFAWYEKSPLPDGKYARFYELKTNKPLFFVKDTYELVYTSDNLPTHYGFVLDYVKRDLERLKTQLAKSREELLVKRALPENEKGWASRAKSSADKAVKALESQDTEGYWLKGDKIDAGEFVRHMSAMSTYVEGANKGGEVFSKLKGP